MDARSQAAHTLWELQRRKTTTKAVWVGARAGAETALVLGTLRRRGTIDAVLKAYSSRRLPLIKPQTMAVLRVALFELLFMDGSPVHAIVNAAVDGAKSFERYKDLGFVNAVLRSVSRGSRRVEPDAATDLRRALPRDNIVVLFTKSVFPDRNHDAAAFLAARASTAPWIARRRLDELGFDRALACLELQASTPATRLRAAPGREDDVRAALDGAGILYGPPMISVPPSVKVGEIFAACGALVVVQDSVAAQVAPYLAPESGWRVLDYCAAPGGKATHLAQLGARVTAWDVDAGRLERVRENAERLGLDIACEPPEGQYDAVLVDAPCSNTAVLARRPEARWRVKERHLAGLVERQLKILREAAAFVRPGGVAVYSTCSLEPEENLGVARCLVDSGTFKLEDARTVYPDEAAGDGGFMARLRRV